MQLQMSREEKQARLSLIVLWSMTASDTPDLLVNPRVT